MTLNEIKAAVYKLLLEKGEYEGASDAIDQQIEFAVNDLVSIIKSWRLDTSKLFVADELADDGQAQLVDIPSGGKLTEVWFLDAYGAENASLCDRQKVLPYPGGWTERFDLICGKAPCHGYFAVNPDATNLYVYPKIDADTILSLHYFVEDIGYLDDDAPTPIPAHAMRAIYLYVMAYIKGHIEENENAALRYYNPDPKRGTKGLYQEAVGKLYRRHA